MLKSYKTEIDPTPEQMQKINQTIGTCRYVYNFYLAHNKDIYEKEKKFISGMIFSKWLNNVYLKENPDKAWKKLEKQLKREQRCLSRKYEDLKKRKNKEGEATRRNIQKQILKVQRLHHRIDNIRTDYINKCVNEVVKTKPSYITIEDLNVLGMMKNRHLSKAVASQKFYEFRTKLEAKCKENGIELRIADRWYPSSKLCHECGCIKKDLKLSDREYICDCGYHADRDYNASLNLRDALTYKIA